jgi:molecular chaperone DnaK
MHVSATDKNTGKENKITIKANSGLTDEEIQRMVKDAEDNAEEDKKRRSLIDTKNSAESQIHNIRRELTEREITDDVKIKVEEAIVSVEEAVKSDNVEEITQK